MIDRRGFISGAAFLAGAGLFCNRAEAQTRSRIVRTALGSLEGVEENGFLVFKGVPFAQPPVGALRFKPPVPVRGWTGVRPALDFSRKSLQPLGSPGRPDAGIGSEDSLYLNIFAPSTPGPHPVAVWLYGGNNTGGDGADPRWDGRKYARNGVICITLNYRVGACGFLELGDLLGPEYRGSGTNGLRDVVCALTWIKQNIATFGGDPNRVTLWGQSAGAKNVCGVIGSPKSKGLVEAAISESGGGQTVHQMDVANTIADLYLGGAGLTRATAGNLLRVSSESLLQAQAAVEKQSPMRYPWRSVVDGDFLPRVPVDGVAAGTANGVRLLIGSARFEAGGFAGTGDEPLKSSELANISVAGGEEVRAKYNAAFPTLSPLENRIAMVSAEEYSHPSWRVAMAHARAERSKPTYLFRIDWNGGRDSRYGARHGVELGAIWDQPGTPEIGKQIQQAWTSFMHGGPPAADTWPAWPRLDPANPMMMSIDAGKTAAIAAPTKEWEIWGDV